MVKKKAKKKKNDRRSISTRRSKRNRKSNKNISSVLRRKFPTEPRERERPVWSPLYRLSALRYPKTRITSRFRPFTQPVRARVSAKVYAFVEISASYSGIGENDETVVVPIAIGIFTRKRLLELSREDLKERLSALLPGESILRLYGFAHEIAPSKRKGKRFARVATKVSRKPRRKGASKRGRSTKARSVKRGSSARIRHRVHKKA